MKRGVGLALGAFVAALAASLAVGPAWGAQKDEGDKVGKKVEKRVVIRHAGGGFLGVSLDDLEGDARGAKVSSVDSGSPADKAGIKEGDVIVRFDGETVRSAAQLARLVGETPPGRSVAIEVTRAGATQKLTAAIGKSDRMRVFGNEGPGERTFHFELPEGPMVQPHPFDFRGDENQLFRAIPGGRPRLGVRFMEMGEQLAAHYKLPGKSGILVTSVDEGSPAAKAGGQAGDAILELDGRKVEDGGDLREAVARAEGEVALKVQREGRALDLKVTLTKPQAHPARERGVEL